MENNQRATFVFPSICSKATKKWRKKKRKWEHKKYLEAIRMKRATFNHHYRSQKEIEEVIIWLDLQLSLPKVLIHIILMYITYPPHFQNELGLCSLPTRDISNYQMVSDNSNFFGIFDLNSFSLRLLTVKSSIATSQYHYVWNGMVTATCKPRSIFYILDICENFFSLATRNEIYIFQFSSKSLLPLTLHSQWSPTTFLPETCIANICRLSQYQQAMYISAHCSKIPFGLYNMFTGDLVQEINIRKNVEVFDIIQIEFDIERNNQIFILIFGEKKIELWNTLTSQLSLSVDEQWMKGNSRCTDFVKRKHVLNDPHAFVLYENFLYILDGTSSIKIFSTLPESFGLFISQLTQLNAGWCKMHIHEKRLILHGMGNPRLTLFA